MTQEQAISIALTGENIFLTGKAGTGKTYTLNKIIDALELSGKKVAKTASTGIAATHIGGRTIHSWAGIGIKDELMESDLYMIANNPKSSVRIKNADVLIIDEVSMLHDYRLDLVDEVMRFVRKDPHPFGGAQVILCGDFYQLPPVTKKGQPKNFTWNAKSWKAANIRTCYLEKVYRNGGDKELTDLLNAIRENAVTEAQKQNLYRYEQNSIHIDRAINLYCLNIDVERENTARLEEINAPFYTFEYQASGEHSYIDHILKNWMARQTLVVKKGAKVMFCTNHRDGEYFNGSMGEVIDFTTPLEFTGIESPYDEDRIFPVVRLYKNGKEVLARPAEWKAEDTDEKTGANVVKARVTQVPLRLAYAITIHKSQGCTFDYANLDLTKVFEENMGYVALSRLTSLDGLYLIGRPSFLTFRTSIPVINKYLEFIAESKRIEDNA